MAYRGFFALPAVPSWQGTRLAAYTGFPKGAGHSCTIVWPDRVVAALREHIPAFTNKKKDSIMNIALTPLISLIAGILILLMPRLLNYIVAIYLIVIGVVGLAGNNFDLTF